MLRPMKRRLTAFVVMGLCFCSGLGLSGVSVPPETIVAAAGPTQALVAIAHALAPICWAAGLVGLLLIWKDPDEAELDKLRKQGPKTKLSTSEAS